MDPDFTILIKCIVGVALTWDGDVEEAFFSFKSKFWSSRYTSSWVFWRHMLTVHRNMVVSLHFPLHNFMNGHDC